MPRTTVYTLCVNNYEPAITQLTFPLIENYAWKIGAEFCVIDERKFPEWPIPVEKLQIRDLARENGSEWNVFFDADALVNPDYFDVTERLPKDTVSQNGKDFAGIRLNMDNYFRRDGRGIGCCGWHTIASEWCLDLWRMPDDLTPQQAKANCHSTIGEAQSGVCDEGHLVDDYILARNIARFGLKHTTVIEICASMGFKTPEGRGFNPFLWHTYAISRSEKIRRMVMVLSAPPDTVIPDPEVPQRPPVGRGWGLMSETDRISYQLQWGKEIYFAPIPGIPGWMGHNELDWLFEQAKTHGRIAEIGSWFGRSTHALCSSGAESVCAVDHFKGTPSELDGPHEFARKGDVFAEFRKNCGHFQNLWVKKGPSLEAAEEFRISGREFDMVFIDGDHTKEAVLADLQAWAPLVRKGGLLCGHDRLQGGVPAALHEFFGKLPEAAAGSIWQVPM